jgi:hypothetical protein
MKMKELFYFQYSVFMVLSLRIITGAMMLKDYSTMSKAELETELRRLQDDFEDFEETYKFHLKNTSDHISGRVVVKGEKELERLKIEIDKIEKLLSKE